ncbi:MAG: NUDIX domain-containing protein [Clostridia bacterium]|nr:NUDIX domain-containing protein [Clostridia bacterium]
MTNEIFAKPAVGAIIEKDINGIRHILIQKRQKNSSEDGLLEIPAGKIREFENIFQALKREVKEETGLTITSIIGKECQTIKTGLYSTTDFSPFCITQNLSGGYSLILFTFICSGEGELYEKSDESSDIKWIPANEIKLLLDAHPEKFFPMHINSLKKYFKRSN